MKLFITSPRCILTGVAFAASLAFAPAVFAGNVQVGMLECDVEGGIEQIKLEFVE